MSYLVHVEGPFERSPGPSSNGSPHARSGAYHMRALFAPAAETAATQVFLAEQAAAGLRPAGPLTTQIADVPPDG